MEQLIRKYDRKLVDAGLCGEGEPLIGFLDADLVWNRTDPFRDELEKVFGAISINSLLFAPPAEPFGTMIDYLAGVDRGAICPKDCETRTFMHDLPVAHTLDAPTIVAALRRRKSVIVPGKGIVTFGTVSPEQAFIVYSSVCFSVFVKFFSDYLYQAKAGTLSDSFRSAFAQAARWVPQELTYAPAGLALGPFESSDSAIRAIIDAGLRTVQYGLVDSFFGNVSYRAGDTIYISQTSSSLDELAGCIDPCPLDGSSCAGVTASSELTAHREALLRTGARAILHGHPRFSVIMSMDCDMTGCEFNGECHRRCPQTRIIKGIPVVPGEVGTGRYGLCNTMPTAMEHSAGVVVYGHGVFARGERDFTDAFDTLLSVENGLRKHYFNRLAEFDALP